QDLYAELNEHPLDGQTFIPPFNEVPTEALTQSASEDGEALNTPVFFDDQASTKELQKALSQLETVIGDKMDPSILEKGLDDEGFHVRFSGPVGIQTDAVSLFSNA